MHRPDPPGRCLRPFSRPQMDMMLAAVDADISTYPVGDVVVEVAERPSSPSSRIFDQARAALPAL